MTWFYKLGKFQSEDIKPNTAIRVHDSTQSHWFPVMDDDVVSGPCHHQKPNVISFQREKVGAGEGRASVSAHACLRFCKNPISVWLSDVAGNVAQCTVLLQRPRSHS